MPQHQDRHIDDAAFQDEFRLPASQAQVGLDHLTIMQIQLFGYRRGNGQLRALNEKRIDAPRRAKRIGTGDQGYRIQFRRDEGSPAL